jgi:hypothetical protein
MTVSRTPRPPRPEPIAWRAVESLTGRAQTIAKGWLLLLLERAPLDGVGTIPAAALAAEGPAICAAVARGLGSDAELERLRADGDLAESLRRIPLLTGARDAAETVTAVDALRACIWTATLDGLVDGADADAVQLLADRLAAVAATVSATALAGAPSAFAAAPATAPPARAFDGAPSFDGGRPVDGAPRFGAAPSFDDGRPVDGAPRFEDAPSSDDGRAFDDAPRFDDVPSSTTAAPAPPFAAPEAPAPSSRNGHGADAPAPVPFNAPNGRAAGPTLQDLRDGGEETAVAQAGVTHLPSRPAADPRHGPAGAMDDSDLWIATLERHIDRCQREGGGLALLRVELVDGERVAASAPEGESHVPYGRLAQAIRRAIRRQDLVASDHQGRAWVIAPGVGRAGAIALAERIGAGVEHGENWRGAPLAATIGFAVYGEDGRDAATLIDRAEEAMLAATAAGVRIGEAIPQPDDLDDSPGPSGPRLVR